MDIRVPPLPPRRFRISTTSSSITDRLAVPTTIKSAGFYKRLQTKLRRKAVRKRMVRGGLLLSNVIVLGIILAVVLQNPHTNGQAAPALLSSSDTGAMANPLDQVSSADIALTVARLGSLPETTAINNQAQSQAADVAIASSSNNVISKPQVVATALKSQADIQNYTVVAGDTIPNLATKFGVTSDSIRWSNGLSGDALTPGSKLLIPPVNGIIYTVKAGDTPESLAAKFNANKDQILAYNDGEISGLHVGEQIIIPNATQTVATKAVSSSSVSGFPWGGSAPVYGSNGYDYGYCTWYVATQINVPSNWGNASTWSYYARMSGWNVSSSPTVGAIAQRGGGEGHVAIVVGVNPDGTVVVRDMNGWAGWGRVGTGTTSAGTYSYITH